MFGSIGCENGVPAFGTMPCGDYAIKDDVQARYAHQNMAMSTLTSKVADHANDEDVFFNDGTAYCLLNCLRYIEDQKPQNSHAVNNTSGIGPSLVGLCTS